MPVTAFGTMALPSHTFYSCTPKHEHTLGSSYHVPTMLTAHGHGPEQQHPAWASPQHSSVCTICLELPAIQWDLKGSLIHLGR